MGMFDYIECRYPLPVAGANEHQYQTKDLVCFMDSYEIREDGTLWHEEYDVEDHSDPSADGLMSLCGMMTRVNKRWVQVALTGEVCFYEWLEPDGWLEWSAYFVDGALSQLHLIQHTADLSPAVAAVDPVATGQHEPSTRVENPDQDR